MAAVTNACQAVTLSTDTSTADAAGTTGTIGAVVFSSVGSAGTLYDCQGRAAALASLGTQQSDS
jgi:hypothetical protein